MIDSRTPGAAADDTGSNDTGPDDTGSSVTRRRRWWFAAVMVAVVLLVGGLLLPTVWSSTTAPAPAAAPASSTSPAASAASPAVPSAAPAAPAPVTPENVVTLPGSTPTHGSGTFDIAPGWSKILGTAGPLRRFRVAVEKGSNEDVAAFADQVVATLGDTRSWVGQGNLRLQRVPGSAAASFTVYLATRDTAGRMCANGGVNVTVAGRPYTSCRTTGRAIINLDRWRLSAHPYVAAKIKLSAYRQYVINHEVGHELGKHHEGCPKHGGPAPVMVQQTLTLRGCVPYSWPREGGELLQGPPV
ncbi:DUF3152 domain-containing protein [Actinoplanes sp. N902-109]|uniref:DUF3152 domain-containing protein n=1 Tax=Actinoplanes sp. (strain N902-109) TaxID=649831 RepID=UPI0003294BFE|nr:DUF3152 domain-containing protein [Actinoplanes sp. N902-109]AGL14373.1 lipoprotein [Actinoplanes sp. N902-109]